MERIHHTALDLLEKVGVASPTPLLLALVTGAGGRIDDEGRLLFPRDLVEDIIAGGNHSFVLPGQIPDHDMEMEGSHVHCGTGGGAPSIIDFETGGYRDATLADLYDIARLVDTLDNIHFFLRSVIARDVPTDRDLDINTAYACMQGTTKHILTSFERAAHLKEAVEMFDFALGREGGFRARPFCTAACCHVVPPMRFAEEACDTLALAVRLGVPIKLTAASQAGATSPSALAGSVVQTVAEVLCGFVFANLIDPTCRCTFGIQPFVSDLRTGAMSGGGGEQAVLMAAAAQMANYYDFPGSVCAGMTDSKVPDAQSGYEKGYTTALATQAGANMVTQAAGMHASLLGFSLESLVIDNDMLGAVLRAVRGIEVTDETLSFEVIRAVVTGEGHYLGHEQTLSGMRSDYLYPEVGDRSPLQVWEQQGARDIRERAKDSVKQTLASHYPAHIDRAVDDRIRERFNILLPREYMNPGNFRW